MTVYAQMHDSRQDESTRHASAAVPTDGSQTPVLGGRNWDDVYRVSF
jgi:hypothetical protein